MKTNDLLKLAAKNLMIQVNREKNDIKPLKQRVAKQSTVEYLFGAVPFMIKCSLNKRKKSG